MHAAAQGTLCKSTLCLQTWLAAQVTVAQMLTHLGLFFCGEGSGRSSSGQRRRPDRSWAASCDGRLAGKAGGGCRSHLHDAFLARLAARRVFTRRRRLHTLCLPLLQANRGAACADRCGSRGAGREEEAPGAAEGLAGRHAACASGARTSSLQTRPAAAVHESFSHVRGLPHLASPFCAAGTGPAALKHEVPAAGK